MNPNQLAQGIVRAIIYSILIGLGIYAIYLLSSLIVFIAIAAVTSLIGRPITVFLKQKLKFRNSIAVISTMSILIILLFGILSLFVPLIIQQGENLSLLDVKALETKINLLFEISKNNWNEETRKEIITAAKSCPVGITLENQVTVDYKFH